MIVQNESCKYTFTGAELVEIAQSAARLRNDMREAEEQFANVKADHKATITRIEADLSKCDLRITSGYEMRQVKCLVLKFRPDGESALIVRTDNGRVLRKRKLDSDEKQLKLQTTEPDPFVFEADFWHDSTSDLVEVAAEHVPLTAKEAEELREAGITLRPLRPLIEGAEERRGKRGKDGAAGN